MTLGTYPRDVFKAPNVPDCDFCRKAANFVPSGADVSPAPFKKGGAKNWNSLSMNIKFQSLPVAVVIRMSVIWCVIEYGSHRSLLAWYRRIYASRGSFQLSIIQNVSLKEHSLDNKMINMRTVVASGEGGQDGKDADRQMIEGWSTGTLIAKSPVDRYLKGVRFIFCTYELKKEMYQVREWNWRKGSWVLSLRKRLISNTIFI